MDETRTPVEEDSVMERAVLQQLLVLHPLQITVEELLREMAVDPENFAERDAIERAVRELAAAGLLRRPGDLAVPSRAALRFDELLGG